MGASAGFRLVVRGIRKEYRGEGASPVSVLKGADLELKGGEAVVIVGPSGSGKSTLLNIIGSLDVPDAGSVMLDQVEVTRLSGEALAEHRRKRVGFVFQEHHLLPQCTARENILLPALAGGIPPDIAAVEGRAADLMKRMGIEGCADRLPSQLSGGERQRVAIARALINRPSLVLADEPTGNLDRSSAFRVVDLFAETCRAEGAMLILVTHNAEIAARFPRVLRLLDGRLEEPAAAADGGEGRSEGGRG